MMFTQVSGMVLATLALSTHALKAPIAGYGVFVPQWEFEVTPGGDHITLNGTVQQVVAQLNESNPMVIQAWHLESAVEAQLAAHAAERRAAADSPYDRERLQCNMPRFDKGKVNAMAEGIAYLKDVKGKPVNGPGPGMCGRVSCSWQTSIWWCNDDGVTKELESFSVIAYGAQMVYDYCPLEKFQEYFANGQAFHKTENINVIIRGTNMKDDDRC
ncbi:hypothetical protein C8035_v001348 [Colletotrichum spinosum]|uniref:Uncharacterized protein n=1 Tax=Colletotrichum spinosum TaxID=1347390 RepID=A0A4R8Q8K3_9PEZI|nr:hypothetical protein C8035_v001348 [Colletotrichum spinosum]